MSDSKVEPCDCSVCRANRGELLDGEFDPRVTVSYQVVDGELNPISFGGSKLDDGLGGGGDQQAPGAPVRAILFGEVEARVLLSELSIRFQQYSDWLGGRVPQDAGVEGLIFQRAAALAIMVNKMREFFGMEAATGGDDDDQ